MHLEVGEILSGFHRLANGFFGVIETGDGSCLDAARFARTDAHNAQLRRLRAPNEANDLRCADIKSRDET